MSIEIKKSIKPVKYNFAINFLEKRMEKINERKAKDLIWILEHEEVYTAGRNYKKSEILNKNINLIKTNRGGKITYHGPGQLVFYFVLNLKERKKNIRDLINAIEKTIINTLSEFKIKSFADRKNIGIWHKNNKDNEKIASIGIKVKKWIAYHGFSINISNDLDQYKKIVPCGIKKINVTNLKNIKNKDYKKIGNILINNFLINIEK